jgi:hypothetical protein
MSGDLSKFGCFFFLKIDAFSRTPDSVTDDPATFRQKSDDFSTSARFDECLLTFLQIKGDLEKGRMCIEDQDGVRNVGIQPTL